MIGVAGNETELGAEKKIQKHNSKNSQILKNKDT